MPRLTIAAILLLAGCATPAAPPPMQLASAATSSDPILLEAFFGPGGNRAISSVIRCAIRCQATQ